MGLKTALLMILLLTGGAVLAESGAKPTKMYKWTDENGTVHYSATPEEKVATEEVAIHSGPKVTTVTAVPGEAPDPAMVVRCEQLRGNLKALESDSSDLQIEENGKIRPMTAEERAPQLAATRAALDRCKDVPPPTK